MKPASAPAIQADAAPTFYLDSGSTAGSVQACLKSAPVGADLGFTIYAGSDVWMTLTVPKGIYNGRIQMFRKRTGLLCAPSASGPRVLPGG